ncbi:adenylyltransferase/cytidyltransferase family protein [Streptomyces sp. NRRL S-813]|uniref:adenylyltransferase/cytidyltransferase family protein n=1 Tax=Streptomyces sp. NRRL S-813 TaxID=1463919 RepID=UPI00055D50C5|nr:adenylyltransferase/cytidyltransferase family protein [Streptomyces sp. NRRL S-813]
MVDRGNVYVDMVGDLFHPGHVALLRAARNFGERLIVGVLSDEVVARYKRRPIMTLAERVAVIEACRYVDVVLPDAPYRVTNGFLDLHGIDVVVHGNDLSADAVKEVFGPVADAGKLRLVQYTAGVSTTELIRRCRAADPS